MKVAIQPTHSANRHDAGGGGAGAGGLRGKEIILQHSRRPVPWVTVLTGLRLVPPAASNPELIILLTATEAAIAIPKANVRGANRRPYFLS